MGDHFDAALFLTVQNGIFVRFLGALNGSFVGERGAALLGIPLVVRTSSPLSVMDSSPAATTAAPAGALKVVHSDAAALNGSFVGERAGSPLSYVSVEGTLLDAASSRRELHLWPPCESRALSSAGKLPERLAASQFLAVPL